MYLKYCFLFFIIISSIRCTNRCYLFKTNNDAIYGLDISQYQNEKTQIDWLQLNDNKMVKVDFIYIRTTMGKDGVDKSKTYNFNNAINNKTKIGIYHFYRPNEDPIEQFNNFKSNNINIGTLPPMIDIEQVGKIGSKKLIKNVLKLLELVEESYHIKPIIYTTQRFYNKYFLWKFKGYDVWIARHNGNTDEPFNNQLGKEPLLLDGKCPLIWQFSGTGTINGIIDVVDLNIANIKLFK